MRMQRSKSPEAVGAHYQQHSQRVMHADKHGNALQLPHKRSYDAYQKGSSSRDQMQNGRYRSRSQSSHMVDSREHRRQEYHQQRMRQMQAHSTMPDELMDADADEDKASRAPTDFADMVKMSASALPSNVPTDPA